jgi:hypothetical protein
MKKESILEKYFLEFLLILLSTAIGGYLNISSPKTQRNITSITFALFSFGVSAAVGYQVGKRGAQGSKQESDVKDDLHLTSDFRFNISRPQESVSYQDMVSGYISNETGDEDLGNMPSSYDERTWLLVKGSESHIAYQVRNIQRIHGTWSVSDVKFGSDDALTDNKVFDIQVVLADPNAHRYFLSLNGGPGYAMPRSGLREISAKVTVKRKLYIAPLSNIVREDSSAKNQWSHGRITGPGYITGDDGTSYFFQPAFLFRNFPYEIDSRVIFVVEKALPGGKNDRATRVFVKGATVNLPANFLQLSFKDGQSLPPDSFCFAYIVGENNYVGETQSLLVYNHHAPRGFGTPIDASTSVTCIVDSNDKGPTLLTMYPQKSD